MTIYNRMRGYAAMLIISSFSTLNLQAQTLDECIAYAKEHSLRVKQSELQVARAKRNEGSFFEIEKTELSLSQDPTSGGNTDNAITLSQSIDFPTVYSARKKMLKAETKVSESQKQLTISELTRDVSTAYCTLLYYDHLVKLYAENDSALDAFVHQAQTRLANGETNRLEVMNAKQQKVDNLIQLQQAQNKAQSANLTLQQLMNTDTPIKVTESGRSVTNDHVSSYIIKSSFLEGSAQSYGASLQLLENEKKLKERELSYVKQGYMPSFSFGTRHQLLFSSFNPYGIERERFEKGNWMGFEVGVSFPLFFGSQRAKTAVAKYDLEIANTRLQEAQRQQETDIRIAQQDVIVAQNAYRQYKEELLGEAHEMRRLSLTEYEAGDISCVEHIQNLSAALAIEVNAAEAILNLNQAIIALNFITGK